MTEQERGSPAAGEESRRVSVGKLVLLGFVAGGGFGFVVTLLYLIFR